MKGNVREMRSGMSSAPPPPPRMKDIWNSLSVAPLDGTRKTERASERPRSPTPSQTANEEGK